VLPLLEKPMDLRRLEEMETPAIAGKGAHYHEDAVKDTSVGDMYQGAA
jgi:hypothetical protein